MKEIWTPFFLSFSEVGPQLFGGPFPRFFVVHFVLGPVAFIPLLTSSFFCFFPFARAYRACPCPPLSKPNETPSRKPILAFLPRPSAFPSPSRFIFSMIFLPPFETRPAAQPFQKNCQRTFLLLRVLPFFFSPLPLWLLYMICLISGCVPGAFPHGDPRGGKSRNLFFFQGRRDSLWVIPSRDFLLSLRVFSFLGNAVVIFFLFKNTLIGSR